MRNLTLATAALMLTATTAFAAPCATGTTSSMKDKSAAMDNSSNVDGGSAAKVTPGAKAESPGTVGAMNNVGANTQPAPGEKKPAEGQVVKGDKADNC
jgi:ABC-type oligopeptide transport system substrate-binding subunit